MTMNDEQSRFMFILLFAVLEVISTSMAFYNKWRPRLQKFVATVVQQKNSCQRPDLPLGMCSLQGLFDSGELMRSSKV